MLLTTLSSAVPMGSVAFRHSARVYTPLLMTAAARVARSRMTTHAAAGASVNVNPPDNLKLSNSSNVTSKEPQAPHQGAEGLHISTYTAFCVSYRYERRCRGSFTSESTLAGDPRGLGSVSPCLLTRRVEGRQGESSYSSLMSTERVE